MNESTRISAALVAEGIGLPLVYRTPEGRFLDPDIYHYDADFEDTVYVDLTDFTSIFGLALKLDAWERACLALGFRLPGEGHMYGQRALRLFAEGEHLGGGHALNWDRVMEGLAATIKHIGMDHAIRRKLGWEVVPGTLAEVQWDCAGCWTLSSNGGEHVFTADVVGVEHETTIEGVALYTTDPTKALKAIYKEVCGG